MPDKIETVNIKGKQHPTYAGVLKKAHEEGLTVIRTELLQAPLEANNYMAIIHARVTTEKGVFDGIGDATPKNVNSMIAPHIVRMAETRAKGRALRDALNIAEALAEELGEFEDKKENLEVESTGSINYGSVDKDEINGYEDELSGLESKCNTCGAKMVEKHGEKNGKAWSGLFCPNAKKDQPGHKPVWL